MIGEKDSTRYSIVESGIIADKQTLRDLKERPCRQIEYLPPVNDFQTR
jgi:hypothetical protein